MTMLKHQLYLKAREALDHSRAVTQVGAAESARQCERTAPDEDIQLRGIMRHVEADWLLKAVDVVHPDATAIERLEIAAMMARIGAKPLFEDVTLADLGDREESHELRPAAGYLLIEIQDEPEAMADVINTLAPAVFLDVMCCSPRDVNGIIVRRGDGVEITEIWATLWSEPSDPDAEFCLVYKALGPEEPPALSDVAIEHYRTLAGGINDMIEAGRLTRADVPDDFDWLSGVLDGIVEADPVEGGR